jgi:hypothetical protein
VIRIRKATHEDVPAYLALQESSWGTDMAVAERKAKNRFDVYLDGILMAEIDGKPVGTTTIIRLPGYDFDHPLTWDEATGDGWCDTHRPDGTICFGVDLSVAKGEALGVVDALMAGCMQLVVEAGTKYCVLGGRMPGFAKYLAKHPGTTAEEYLWTRNSKGRFFDPQVNMYSKVPRLAVMKLIPDYFDDPESLNNGVLLRWRNPFYRLPGSRFCATLPVRGYNLWQRYERRFGK